MQELPSQYGICLHREVVRNIPKFYHLDRSGLLLLEKDIINLKSMTQNLILNNVELFNDGISNHGNQYLNLNYVDKDSIHTNTKELILELVRQKYFQEKPSRLQSFFAFGSLEEAVSFKDKYHANGEFCVWEIEAEIYVKGDMNLLSTPIRSNREYLEVITKYWKGEASENPMWEYLLSYPIKRGKRICSGEIDYYLYINKNI